MDTLKAIKDLECCLDADCRECGHAQTASEITCSTLLKAVLVKVRQLAVYERLLKQGKMVKLPCAVGDEIYWISDEDCRGNKVKTVMAERVRIIGVCKDGFYASCADEAMQDFDRIGSRWALLTRKEAEKMAEEMNADI